MARRNRRQFLEDSMFAAAAAVAGSSSAPLFGADQETQSDSPNDKLGVAVVGVRGRGNSHISEFAGRKDTQILYICDADCDVGLQRVKEVGKRQGGSEPGFVEDLRHVLDDPRVDILTIATPNHWHALAAIWAIQAGKDVYLEKPVSHNVSEGRRVVEAARKHQKICQTGTQCRSNPGMIRAMEYIHSGKIGDVFVARGLCYKPRGSIGAPGHYEVPQSVNYDLWLGPAPIAPLTRPQFHYDWHWQWAYGNGDLGNQGIHQMDLARWALGESRLSDNVLSYGGRFGYEDAGETANTQVVIHDYGDKSLVFEVRGLRTDSYRGSKIGIIVEGSEGYVVMSSYSNGAAFDPEGRKTAEFSGSGNHFDNFVRAVRSRKHQDLTADVEEGHYSSALCHMGNISYLLGQELGPEEAAEQLQSFATTDNAKETLERTLQHLRENDLDLSKTPLRVGALLACDPATEKFRHGAEANQMLTREYRKGFEVPARI